MSLHQAPAHAYMQAQTGSAVQLTFTGPLQEDELEGDPVNRMRLEQLHPERFSSVLILADDSARVSESVKLSSVGASIADADSRCLASLLLLRDIQSTRMPLTNKSMHACAHPPPQHHV